MTIQTNIPPDLTDMDRVDILQNLDALLQSMILLSLLYGIYTGIVAITLGNILMSKSRSIQQAMIAVLILLHVLTTIDFAINWSQISSAFVNNGQSFWTSYVFYDVTVSEIISLVGGIISTICTVLADSTIIWRCWIVWGQRWLIILLPVLFLLSAMASKVTAIYKQYITGSEFILGFVLYSSFILATTLWCTLLIVYRIISVAWAGNQAGNGLRAYRHAIEILIESSALYSMSLILYTAFYACGDLSSLYLDSFAGIARVIAPTLLVGRVAAGHARPDDSWQGSVISGSIHFGTHSRGQNSQQDSMMSSNFEAQAAEQNIDDEYGHPTMMDFQEDLVNKGSVHEDSHKALQERVEDGGDINSKDVVHGDDIEAQLNGSEDAPTAVLVIQRD
ncbi:hypothetical protein ARMSODRAFT_1090023 [Armillaria solidipes]|uniref:Uncharacterized protein n=1 Tax=Armillaria solidipes TaxID=1076256 RepID=A0A2H3B4A9_9AGAR|nr:hypothetical protein ARMSODRAFT_1090023 [Armillaria solidipes]